MERGEHGRIRPDAERQGHDRDDRDKGGLEQGPEGELQVAHGLLDEKWHRLVYEARCGIMTA